MAWFGRLSQPATISGNKIQITIEYYDDTILDGGVPRVLHIASSAWSAATQLEEVTAWLISEGRSARAAYEVMVSFNQNVPVGTVVVVT